jgi:KaiC/GvpD/RAD55 family RecA-like ATPase
MDGMESSMPLAAPYKLFSDHEALFYRGAVSLLAGGPGSGKTISALNFVDRIRAPTLYISNDSTKYTIVNRVFSLLTHQEMAISKEIIAEQPEIAQKALQKWSNVRFNFSSKPDIHEIARHGDAFREIFGEYPHLTVVDILMNLDHEGVAEQNYWRVMPELKAIAGEWNTALLAVHHTSEQAKGEPCPPMSSIMGKANQLPELIITQAMVGENVHYAVVKNRNGPSDASGKRTFALPVFPAQFRIEDAKTVDYVQTITVDEDGKVSSW